MNLEEMSLIELKATAFDLVLQLQQIEAALKMIQERMQILNSNQNG